MTRYSPLPQRGRAIGVWLFLASLTMLFAAAMLGYVLIRLGGAGSPPAGAITIPWTLALSTLTLIAGSVTIENAVRLLSREKQSESRRQLAITLILALIFIAIQTPSLIALLAMHQSSRAQGLTLYGLVFVLILLHGLHVVGGVIPLIVTMARARQNRYDHEHYGPVRHLAMYWHFLGAVWLVMLAVFLVVR